MIKVENLTKVYKVPKQNYKKTLKNILWRPNEDKYGVKDISFEVNKGEMVAFVGPNGAGKTTTIKMLSGILTPTRGEIDAFGHVPFRDRKNYTKEIGVLMGQKSVLFYDIPVIESFKFFKEVYALNDKEFNERLELLVDKLDLKPLLGIPVRKLSLGQRMKCEIVSSILHNPKIVFLDEPTLGLDIVAKQNIIEFFKYLNEEFKTTIFLTTHDINDIDRLCERIIIIDKGEIRYDGAIKAIKERDQFKVVDVMHDKKFNINIIDNNLFNVVSQDKYKTSILVPKENLNVIGQLINNPNVIDLNINSISLEDILHDIYKDKDRSKIYA